MVQAEIVVAGDGIIDVLASVEAAIAARSESTADTVGASGPEPAEAAAA